MTGGGRILIDKHGADLIIFLDVISRLQIVIFGFSKFCWYIYGFHFNNEVNNRDLFGQSAMVHCASKPMENSRVLTRFYGLFNK